MQVSCISPSARAVLQVRLLTGLAMSAAERTAWPPKVVALGRMLAAGLIAEDAAAVDVQQLAMTAMADVKRPHVVLLDLLVRYEPDAEMGVGWKGVPRRVPSYQSRYVGGDGQLFWTQGRRVWTAHQICDVRHQLAQRRML